MSSRPAGKIGTGSVVAGYRLIDVLGVGGSGTVYRAQQDDGPPVALKLLNAEHAHDEGERQRFAREAEVVRRLAHPHVVELLDYGFADHLPYLVFPLLEGRTLEKRIAAEGKVGWNRTGRFCEQALSALEVAHAMGIAHRDIKPANIFCCLFEGKESIRMLDFGTAKIVGRAADRGSDVTRAGMLIGTPRYMAPEQARGEELTPAADVYAFGLVMAEMLLGRPLVTGAADLDIYVVQGSDRPHELPEEIRSSPFATIIERAVAKPLDVRYRLASQMLADVRAILARFGQGAATLGLQADLEVTRAIGMAGLAAAVPESAVKLRKAFNAMAEKAAAETAPAPSKASAAPAAASAQPTAEPAPSQPVAVPAQAVPPQAPPPQAVPPQALPPRALPTPTPTPTTVHSPPAPEAPSAAASAARTSSSGARVAMLALFAVAAVGVGVAYFAKKGAADGAAAVEASSTDVGSPTLAGATASASAVSAPPATAPPGAFTTAPIDRAPLARFLDKKDAKQTPELYELALTQMADCELLPGDPPTCPAFVDFEATVKRPMKKGAKPKRLEIATKHLQHASPSVRLLAARTLASASAPQELDALIAAARVEPVSFVLAEMLSAMTSDRPDFVELETGALGHASPLVRAAACGALGAKPGSAPVDPIQRAARGDADLAVRTRCFWALTALWVRTMPADPSKEAYEATLAILEEKSRDPAHLPEALGRIGEAKSRISADDEAGVAWAQKAKVFYDNKRLADALEGFALDAQVSVSLRRAALKALGSIDGKARAASVRKKVRKMSDEGSKTLAGEKKPAPP